MKIKALIGIDNYSLMVCHCYGKLYQIGIINQENIVHSFEGVYPSLSSAINRGRAVIKNLSFIKQIR